jgi:hypothetical protein
MSAGSEEGLHRRPPVGLSVIMWLLKVPDDILKEKTMKQTLLLSCGIFALISICGHPAAWANDASGKNCRMEQQCHWEN